MDMKEMAEKGQKIYEQKYRKKLEKSHRDRFVAIDVFTEQSYLGDTPGEATEAAQEASQSGFFHLIRIGHNGVYHMGILLPNTRQTDCCAY